MFGLENALFYASVVELNYILLCNQNEHHKLNHIVKKLLCFTVDVDECQYPANCKNGHCVNTQDSYYCICTSPWILATDRNGCVTPEEQAGEQTCTMT